jgi:hypothetical protein
MDNHPRCPRTIGEYTCIEAFMLRIGLLVQIVSGEQAISCTIAGGLLPGAKPRVLQCTGGRFLLLRIYRVNQTFPEACRTSSCPRVAGRLTGVFNKHRIYLSFCVHCHCILVDHQLLSFMPFDSSPRLAPCLFCVFSWSAKLLRTTPA